MSKQLTKDELVSLKSDAIQRLDSLLSDFIDSSDEHLNKKASLLSYWLKTYTHYINREDEFDPSELKSYKRGDIVKLNFGFNVGSENGGLHYAIVINNQNARNSPVLTVIPLTSQKDGEPTHPNDVFLGNEIYRNLKLKYDAISQNLQKEKEEIDKMQLLFDPILDSIDEKLKSYGSGPIDNKLALDDIRPYLVSLRELQVEWDEKAKKNKEASMQLKKIGAEINRMKRGSIALVEQITTVSKIRIYDPRNAKGVLSGIRLSPDALDKVNTKLKELYIF